MAGVGVAHPPVFVDDPMEDEGVFNAVGNYTKVISSHLAPFQSVEVEMLLSAQKQVSGAGWEGGGFGVRIGGLGVGGVE